MKERLSRQLHPNVQQALREAQRIAGKAPIVKAVETLPHGTNALLKRPAIPGRAYEIHYLRRQERLVDHLIVHEIGHIVRLHRAPDAERLQAAVTPATREYVALQLLDDAVPLLNAGLSPEQVANVIADWHESLATQLANFPADLRIEQWMHDRFPRLRATQERSLVEEVGRSYPLLQPAVAALTPSRVYWPTMAMNAAQAWHVSTLYRRPGLLTPFAQTNERLVVAGEHLARVVFDAPDRGHRSDMEATERWMGELNLQGWFEWQPYQEGR